MRLRSALRPARALRWVAGPALVVLLGTLFALARLAAGDPVVRLQNELAAAGFDRVAVSADVGAPAQMHGAHVTVEYRSTVGVAETRQQAEQLLREVWLRYDGRLTSVEVRPAGGSSQSADYLVLEQRFGPRPSDRSVVAYDAGEVRGERIVLLAVLALLTTVVLVICASVAAVLILRAGRRTPAA